MRAFASTRWWNWGAKNVIRRNRTIVHVTESYGGGVAAAIKDYCRNFPAAEHHLVYAPREDAPVESSQLNGFSSIVELGPGHLNRVIALRRFLGQHPEAIVHAHSSFGGFYARTAIRKSARRAIVYTAHCYGFERKDVANWKRAGYWAIEWLLAFNTTTFASCSMHEHDLSRWPFSSAKRVFVTNVPAQDLAVGLQKQIAARPLRVVGAGRLSPQKDPHFFRDCIVQLRNAGYTVDPLWIGGGDSDVEKMLLDSGIRTTGWLPRDAVLAQLRGADFYLHSARWEGFPIAVLEASIVGVPIIARDICAFAGVDLPCRIGSASELPVVWPKLESAAVRQQMVRDVAESLEGYNDKEQAEALMLAYGS
jgi:glycosyltransferase involved in cell wall biosynthesis